MVPSQVPGEGEAQSHVEEMGKGFNIQIYMIWFSRPTPHNTQALLFIPFVSLFHSTRERTVVLHNQ